MKHYFKIEGRFDSAAKHQNATVTVDRAPSGPWFTVRVARARLEYTLPLTTVAEMVVQRIIKLNAEAGPKRGQPQ